LTALIGQRAHAFGGLWSTKSAPAVQAAQRVIFIDNPDATITALVELAYEGSAERFVWLIPVPGKPTVSVTSSVVFDRLDAATAPQHWLEVSSEVGGSGAPAALDPLRAASCVARDPSSYEPTGDAGVGWPARKPGASTPVTILEQHSTGPYDYVLIAGDRSLAEPEKAATDWLTANGYEVTTREGELLRPYLKQGFNLLAFRLTKGTSQGAIRPVSLTYESAQPRIPIIPTAVATRADLSIQVWIIGPSQAVPTNYRSLVLNDAMIDWQQAQKFLAGTPPSGGGGPSVPFFGRPSNYDVVVSTAANEAGGQGFVTELAEPASQFRDAIWSTVDASNFEELVGETYTDGLDALLAARERYGRWDGFAEAVSGATTLPGGVTFEAFQSHPDQFRGAARVDADKLFALLRERVIAPVSSTATLFFQGPYLTRLYSTLSAYEMTLDPSFDYNFDLTQINHVQVAKQTFQCKPGQAQTSLPWRIELPQGGVVAGTGSGPWPVSLGSIPSNLKVVQLSTSGPGAVIVDNRAAIANALFSAATAVVDPVVPRPPQTGVAIGGTQRVIAPGPLASTRADSMSTSADGCQISAVGTRTGYPLLSWLPLVVTLLVRRGSGRSARARANSGPRAHMRTMLAWLCLGACLALAACSPASPRVAPVDKDASVPRPDAAVADVSVSSGEPTPPHALSLEQLRDPETCKGCHPVHYREWSSSMHAYAAVDPVFLAMNKRGQRETKGALGDFCVKCHAPMAVYDKLTPDGLDLATLPDSRRGVSCYFCHNVVGVDGDSNGMLRIANDSVMRGPLVDPVRPPAHGVASSDFLEEGNPQSSAMCGACHDVVMPNGIRLERTYQEYLSGIFSKSASGEPPAFDTCVGCHMPPRPGLAAVQPSGLGERLVHEHLWPGVDLPLTDFPFSSAMRSAVEACSLQKSIGSFTLEVTPPDIFTFQIEAGAGHNQPSGAAQDRRMWLEFLAYDQNGKLLETFSSGNIADGEIEERPVGDPKHDPHLLMFRDHIFGADGKPVHMFWEVERSKDHPDGHEANLLPPATTTYVEGKHAVVKQYRAHAPDGSLPARVTARLRIRPVGLDVLVDLVESGDLDPAVVDKMQTLDFGPGIEWTPADGLLKPIAHKTMPDCSTYRCLMDPSSPSCQ
jgi:hypothetical protein